MASRAVGALLGLAAAALIAVSLVTSAWWNGHPRVNGKTFEAKAAHIGLHGGTGCNTGGAGGCETLPLGGMYRAVAFGELAIGGIAAVLVLLVGVGALRGGSRRKPLAKVALPALGLAALAAVALVVIGPGMHLSERVDVPIGWGMLVFWGGLVAGAAAAISTLVARPEPLRLKVPPRPAAPPPAFDVRDILREQHDSLRPAALGPEPRLGLPADLPIDPAALGHAPTPLIQGAPQLRALFEADGAGMVPAPIKPPLPLRGPTPLPRDMVAAVAGVATPPPVAPPVSKTLPPPLRGKPPSVAPPVPERRPTPLPQRPSAPRAAAESGSTRSTIAHTVPPPPIPDSLPPPPKLPAGQGPVRLATVEDDRLDTAMRETDAITAVEVDADAKAAAKAAAQAASTREVHDTAQEPVALPPETTSEPTDVSVRPPPAPQGLSDTIRAQPEPQGPSAAIRAEPEPDPPARPSAQLPLSTAPASLPPPKDPVVASSGPTPACPQCEAPMAWVEEHLRFYCKQCRMYF